MDLENIKEWLGRLGGYDTPLNITSEEESYEERELYQDERDATPLGRISIPLPVNESDLDEQYKWKYFIDGTFRLIPIKTIRAGSYHIPIHVAHIVAGATERVGKTIKPFKKVEAIVVIAPFFHIKRLLNTDLTVSNSFLLNKQGDIYLKIKQYRFGEVFVTDSSRSLALNRGLIISSNDLSKIGLLRRKAHDRALVLMRVLELGLAIDVINETEDGIVVMDGPLAIPLKYSRLVSKGLREIIELEEGNIGDRDRAYEYLRRLLGVIKNVYFVPKGGLQGTMFQGNTLEASIYKFHDIVADNSKSFDSPPRDSVSRLIISAYLNPRYEIKQEIFKYWSPLAGYIRLDIPLPAIVSKNEPWEQYDFQPILTNSRHQHYQAISEILKHAVIEKYPIARLSTYRTLTEYYPLFETEQWIKASLIDKYELRAMFA